MLDGIPTNLSLASSSLQLCSSKDVENSFIGLQEKGVLRAITLPLQDNLGNIVQLWQLHKIFFGTIRDARNIDFISSRRISNGMCPQESPDIFLSRIASIPLKKWGLAAIHQGHSFTEAVSNEKIFFYDGLLYASGFVKDLLATANSHLSFDDPCVELFRLYFQMMKKTDWIEMHRVDEEFFSSSNLSLEEMGERIGELLQEISLKDSFGKFCKILKEQYSFNEVFCNLVKRCLYFKEKPVMETLENEAVEEFLQEEISFTKMYRKIQKSLHVNSSLE
jgi:hypothetical protein